MGKTLISSEKLGLHAGVVFTLLIAAQTECGKQRVILQLREPLRPYPVEIVLPGVTNAHGETRDVKTALNLGDSSALENFDKPKGIPDALSLDMSVVHSGGRSLSVRITLPQAAFVEVFLMDLYGKNLGTLLESQCPRGELFLRPYAFKENESGGLVFLAMRVNGKIAMKRAISQVQR